MANLPCGHKADMRTLPYMLTRELVQRRSESRMKKRRVYPNPVIQSALELGWPPSGQATQTAVPGDWERKISVSKFFARTRIVRNRRRYRHCKSSVRKCVELDDLDLRFPRQSSSCSPRSYVSNF